MATPLDALHARRKFLVRARYDCVFGMPLLDSESRRGKRYDYNLHYHVIYSYTLR